MKTGKRKIKTEVLAELHFLEALSRRCAKDTDVLKALSDLYTKVGRYEDGLKIDLGLSALCPREPLVWYNLACSYAMTARADEALSALSRAVDLGYRDVVWIREDSDLASIRKDSRFKALLQRLLTGKDASRRSA
jgi:predicted Zn-dependent protease